MFDVVPFTADDVQVTVNGDHSWDKQYEKVEDRCDQNQNSTDQVVAIDDDHLFQNALKQQRAFQERDCRPENRMSDPWVVKLV